ncbi:MAG: hypothetical protein U5K73_08780 [Halofilum sp. (in: g-proteobacteria)]|nr:hypothetical protein [Halofilum sp. (in: g-proteobacteria)]
MHGPALNSRQTPACGYVVELGVSGPAPEVDVAFAALEDRLEAHGIHRIST